jgi:phage head-tail adaptor, putative, SPP1 family
MRLTFLDPGRLTARLDLEAEAATPDGQGGAVVAWSHVASLWGLVEPVSARPHEEAGATAATITHRVTMRMRGDVARGMRLVHRGRALAIRAVHDPDARGAYLVCLCEEDGR